MSSFSETHLKQHQRATLHADIAAFLAAGGVIRTLPAGVSGTTQSETEGTPHGRHRNKKASVDI